jgi:uncharacterized membrane protein (DUF2068 family)
MACINLGQDARPPKSALFLLRIRGGSLPNVPVQSKSRVVTATGLRLIAVFEASKGLLVLLAGLGLLSLLHRDAETLAEEFVERRLLIHHLRLSGVLLRAAAGVTDREVWTLASVALAYAALRFVEAYGLWHRRNWGQWLALLSGILYLPWEFLAVVHHPTATHYALILINGALIAYLTSLRCVKIRPGS